MIKQHAPPISTRIQHGFVRFDCPTGWSDASRILLLGPDRSSLQVAEIALGPSLFQDMQAHTERVQADLAPVSADLEESAPLPLATGRGWYARFAFTGPNGTPWTQLHAIVREGEAQHLIVGCGPAEHVDLDLLRGFAESVRSNTPPSAAEATAEAIDG
ncbi:MAG: hypothetical protein AAFQ53_10515 [Bacteroidota bacterium]